MNNNSELKTVYVIFRDDGSGYERFFGIFSDYDKAINLCKSCPSIYGYFVIRKIDLDKIYLTNINEYDIKSSTHIGTHVITLDSPENKIDVTEDFKSHLHENNDFDGYISEEGEEDEGSLNGFAAKCRVSTQLKSFIGVPEDTLVCEPEITSRICKYIKEHNLQNTEDGRKIDLEKPGGQPLRELLGVPTNKELTFYNLRSFLKPHYNS